MEHLVVKGSPVPTDVGAPEEDLLALVLRQRVKVNVVVGVHEAEQIAEEGNDQTGQAKHDQTDQGRVSEDRLERQTQARG